ncbi:hypothetical protein H072_10055 [Dactylellina haptotyla CBS 200.50]|uniref:NTF2 domain-containing protein n=1 Tax=Dactylellina haptotyla (strain CBS 200.50) TaxID=1284197 RepID=S8BBA9_DACHA|nr:hypothetical protein H072_10055 [Dactylellina haptotyla CBS 200.50]
MPGPSWNPKQSNQPKLRYSYVHPAAPARAQPAPAFRPPTFSSPAPRTPASRSPAYRPRSPANPPEQAQNSGLEDDILIQLAYTAAKAFVNTYYVDLHSNRGSLAKYYTPTPTLAWNGNALANGSDVEKLHVGMPPATYEVQCFDAQPLLPNGRGQCSILLATNGYIKFGEDKDAPLRGFSESFILEPDNSTPVNFLISSQSTRFVF